MIQFLMLFHLVGLALSLGGTLCQLVLLTKYQHSGDLKAKVGSERMAGAIIRLVQNPGVYLAIATGVGLAWIANWDPFYQGWLQFKLLFVFWILLATRLMSRNAANICTLREQCGDQDSDRLRSLKDNHRMIGYVTILSFLLVMVFSLWQPF